CHKRSLSRSRCVRQRSCAMLGAVAHRPKGSPRSMNALRIALPLLLVALFANAQAPESPWIESVVPADVQPHASSPAVIWYDDFDTPTEQYGEAQGGLDTREAFGGAGNSVELRYDKGAQGHGGRKIFFGDAPAYRAK